MMKEMKKKMHQKKKMHKGSMGKGTPTPCNGKRCGTTRTKGGW